MAKKHEKMAKKHEKTGKSGGKRHKNGGFLPGKWGIFERYNFSYKFHRKDFSSRENFIIICYVSLLYVSMACFLYIWYL